MAIRASSVILAVVAALFASAIAAGRQGRVRIARCKESDQGMEGTMKMHVVRKGILAFVAFVGFGTSRDKILFAVVVASCAFLAPAELRAQGEQIIAMSCPKILSVIMRIDITLDLSSKRVSGQNVFPDGSVATWEASVTQVTDSQVTFVWGPVAGLTATYILNRYTGLLQDSGGATYTCQGIPKQF